MFSKTYALIGGEGPGFYESPNRIHTELTLINP